MTENKEETKQTTQKNLGIHKCLGFSPLPTLSSSTDKNSSPKAEQKIQSKIIPGV